LTKKQLVKYRGGKRALWQKRQKLNRVKQGINKLDKNMGKPILPLCWGSKKSFKAQYNLEENGFKTHAAWLNWYRKKRDSQINYIGSVSEPHGNQNAQLDYDWNTCLFSLKIRKDLEFMADDSDRFLHMDKIGFKYHRDKLIELIKLNETPLTVRIIRRGVKWYLQVIITWTHNSGDIQTRIIYGAIGLDYNDGFIEVSETDPLGNLTRQEHIPLSQHGTGNKAKSEIQQKIAALVKQALDRKKPIIAEDLNFAKTKAKTLPGSNKKYNKMLHAFDYARYKDMLDNAAFRNNVGLVYINPAYTSAVGISKYQDKKKLNRHQAASYVIARKGQNYIDRAYRCPKKKKNPAAV